MKKHGRLSLTQTANGATKTYFDHKPTICILPTNEKRGSFLLSRLSVWQSCSADLSTDFCMFGICNPWQLRYDVNNNDPHHKRGMHIMGTKSKKMWKKIFDLLPSRQKLGFFCVLMILGVSAVLSQFTPLAKEAARRANIAFDIEKCQVAIRLCSRRAAATCREDSGSALPWHAFSCASRKS